MDIGAGRTPILILGSSNIPVGKNMKRDTWMDMLPGSKMLKPGFENHNIW